MEDLTLCVCNVRVYSLGEWQARRDKASSREFHLQNKWLPANCGAAPYSQLVVVPSEFVQQSKESNQRHPLRRPEKVHIALIKQISLGLMLTAAHL